MTVQTTAYAIRRSVPLSYGAALVAVRQALQQEGFGILCEIDIRKTLKEKLGVSFKPYTILGACNPPLAYKALQAESDLGLLLPCNVIVYDNGEESIVAAINPDSMVEITGNPALREVADDARARLTNAIASI